MSSYNYPPQPPQSQPPGYPPQPSGFPPQSPRKRKGAAVALILAMVLVAVGIIAFILYLVLGTNTLGSATDAAKRPDYTPRTNEIVVALSWAQDSKSGALLDAAELEALEDIYETRLERADIAPVKMRVEDGSRIVIAATDAETDAAVIEQLTREPNLTIRPVIERLPCETPLAPGADDPDAEIVACDVDSHFEYELAPAQITGTEFESIAAKEHDEADAWVVSLKFTAAGEEAFANMTADHGTPDQVDAFALVFDGQVLAAPEIHGKIDGAEFEISGNFGENEAKALATQLRIGSGSLTTEVEHRPN